MSVVSPRSKCPGCKKLIYWFENIPILSYVFLRGKCSECDFKISVKYPLVEFLSGLVVLLFFINVQNTVDLYYFAFEVSVFLIFLALFLIDLKHKLLPDTLNLYLAAILMAYSVVAFSWQHIALGVLIGGGFPFIITWLFYKIRGQIGLGGGDIKLWAALGIYLGPVDIVHNIFMSCFLGAVVGLSMIAAKVLSKENPIPFGPFILIVASIQIFFPDLYTQIRSLLL